MQSAELQYVLLSGHYTQYAMIGAVNYGMVCSWCPRMEFGYEVQRSIHVGAILI